MRPSFILSSLVLGYLPARPAQPVSEDMNFFNSDNSADDPALKTDDIFATSPSLRDSQDLTISQDHNQLDISLGPGSDLGLDTTNAGGQVIPAGMTDFSVADHDILESVCILNDIGPAIKPRQIIFPEWFPFSNWLFSPPAAESTSDSDICIPPKTGEPRCEPGEETLCCTGESNWVDDSMVLIVTGCARCTYLLYSLVFPWRKILVPSRLG